MLVGWKGHLKVLPIIVVPGGKSALLDPYSTARLRINLGEFTRSRWTRLDDGLAKLALKKISLPVFLQVIALAVRHFRTCQA